MPRGLPDFLAQDVDHMNFDGQWSYLQSRTAIDTTVTRLDPGAPVVSLGALPDFDFDGPGRPEMSWSLDRGGATGEQ